jgi:hypothetical protein
MEIHETDFIGIEAVEHWEPWVPPRTGSKRYQRRRAQRWPKGQ